MRVGSESHHPLRVLLLARPLRPVPASRAPSQTVDLALPLTQAWSPLARGGVVVVTGGRQNVALGSGAVDASAIRVMFAAQAGGARRRRRYALTPRSRVRSDPRRAARGGACRVSVWGGGAEACGTSFPPSL